MATTALHYVIDEDDRLVRVSDSYYRFASENGWTGADASLGRLLWDFVSGQQLRTLLRILVRRVRGTKAVVELPFRCDGPDVRREMDIRIAPTASGRAVLFETRIRSEVPREFQPLLDPEADRGEELVEMCGWCDRFLVEEEWVEVEEAAARLELFKRSEPPAISHGICPQCAEKLRGA
jgi:hypothetical protein